MDNDDIPVVLGDDTGDHHRHGHRVRCWADILYAVADPAHPAQELLM